MKIEKHRRDKNKKRNNPTSCSQHLPDFARNLPNNLNVRLVAAGEDLNCYVGV